MKSFIEAGSLLNGTRIFRMNCPRCTRVGAWLTDLNDAERSLMLHEKHEHAQKAVA
jgi:hypothetical protein